jgi:predicted acetyltransferase
MPLELVWPSLERLPPYAAALRQGWSPSNERSEGARLEELGQIEKDPAGFVSGMVDRDAKGPSITLPDGSQVPRLPGYRRWIWDGEFCGVIGFRWQPGTSALPPHVLGHIGYAVVPWKRGHGYATLALRQILPDAKQQGLPYVEITTDPHNAASRKVIEANGGRLVERFRKTEHYGGVEALRFRIDLAG